mgnify:CR=1 FL=1
MVFSAVYGRSFVREGDVRRDATLDDFRRLSMLAQTLPELDSAGGVICEPNDAPLDSRHLDMIYALQTRHRQDLHGQRGLRPERRRHHRDDRRSCSAGGETIEQTPGHDLADQLQLAAALGRPDAGRPVRVLRGQPGRSSSPRSC